ncbi:MAG: peptidylprolyl isomerase [Gammaproteobacteria bacterium]
MKYLPILLVALFATACTPANSGSASSTPKIDSTKTVVATVDGEPIYQEMVDFYRKARFNDAPVTPEQTKQVIDDITQLYSMVGEAKRQGLDKDVDIAMRVKMQSLSMLAQAVMQKHNEDNPVTEEMVRAAYDSGSSGTEYKARHILVKEEAEAREVIASLDAGGDFADLAEEHSTGPSGPRGGDLGWFPAAQMVKPFGDALPGIEEGTYGKEPVQTQFGWHVILVEETRKAEFEQVAAKLREQLATDQVNKFLEDVKAKAQIVNKL